MDLTVASLLIRTVERHPDREALVAGGLRWTYESWNARINQAANSFSAMGIRPLDRVLVCVNPGEAGLTSFMACQKLGAIAVTVNIPSSQGELFHILQHAGARAVVYASEVADIVAHAIAGNRHVIRISVGDASADNGHNFDEMVAAACKSEPSAHVSPEMTSTLTYTAGTKGPAKGALHTHANHVAIAINCALEYQLTAGDRALHIAPPHHVGGMQASFTPHLLVGAANIIAKRYSVNSALDTIAEEHVTSLNATPTQIHEMFFHPAFRLHDTSSLRAVTTGGAAIQVDTLERVLSLGRPRLYVGYGMTEANLMPLHNPREAPIRLGLCADQHPVASHPSLSMVHKLMPS